MEEIYQDLYDIAKKMSRIDPYMFSSPYYSIKDVAEALSQALPDHYRKEYMSFVRKRIKNLSNYAGD